jgi:outer membrane protein assembly factor BamB
MKIQCACGTKYAFDITPEMAQKPVQFVCQNCGLDSSEFVNELIRQELEAAAAAGESSPAISPASTGTPIKLSLAQPAVQPRQPAAAVVSSAPQPCLKHNGELATHRCLVCQKPICPKCMELFGYVCSPFCKVKAEALKIEIPVYEGQKTVVEAKFWRKVGRISAVIGTVVAVLVGFWFWYAWFGSVPRPVFSVRFDDRAYSGQVRLCGKDQIVFLHGATLARYDLKTKKEIWSRSLLDKQQIADAVAEEMKDAQAVIEQAKKEVWEVIPKMPSREELTQNLERMAAAGLQLYVRGQNVWVGEPGKLTHCDWDTGRPLQEIPLTGGFAGLVFQNDELLSMEPGEQGQQLITHINLASGESRKEEIGQPGNATVAVARKSPGTTALAMAGVASSSPTAGLPVGVPGTDMGKPMDPAKVAEQAQSLPLPARIALPAVLANAMHQERILKEANSEPNEQPRSRPRPGPAAARLANNLRSANYFSLIPSQYGYVQFAVRLLESKTVAHEAMKAAPRRSALDSADLNVTKTADVANEILNEMQRERGGATVEEDVSRYEVTIHRADAPGTPDWTGEVIGPPALHPLKTVNVLTAGKTVTVFDKTNKKLWQAALTYNVLRGPGGLEETGSPYGDGPCVERGDTLYIFDQAVLTAFDLATGNARWRLPSVGIVGLFFDDRGMMYVNTTSASPESIKYSKQIDITQQVDVVLLKIDPKTGKLLWSAKPGGFISYLSGKFLYTVWSYDPGDTVDVGAALAGITPNPPSLRIRRINPKDGEIMWDYHQERAPLDIQFNGNSIQLVFKKEVQVLKFFSF